MNLFTRTKCIASISLVVATAGGTAIAAIAPPPSPSNEGQAPSTCEGSQGTAAPDMTAKPHAKESSDLFGPEKLIADALSKECLSDDQRAAIEQLGKTVTPKEAAVTDARHAFVTALGEQFRAGKIDEDALKDKIDALVKANEEAAPAMRKAFEDLHAILDPGQRAALTDAIDARMKELSEASSSWFDQFAKDLGLSDDQKSRVQDVLAQAKADAQNDRSTARAVFDAFKQDHFSVEEEAPLSEVGQKTKARAERMVAVAKNIAAILTPEQRNTLADRIEAKSGQTTTGSGGEGAGSGQPAGSGGEGTGEVQQQFVAARGFRAGAVGGWGGGFGYARGVGVGFGGVGAGYMGGYPFIGGYGPGIW